MDFKVIEAFPFNPKIRVYGVETTSSNPKQVEVKTVDDEEIKVPKIETKLKPSLKNEVQNLVVKMVASGEVETQGNKETPKLCQLQLPGSTSRTFCFWP